MWSSTTPGKCFITEAIGTGTTCPKPQIGCCRIAVESSFITCMSSLELRLRSSLSTSRPFFANPPGTVRIYRRIHCGKSAWRLSAMSNMQRSSAQTTMAPEPDHGSRSRYCVPVQRRLSHGSRQNIPKTVRKAQRQVVSCHQECRAAFS